MLLKTPLNPAHLQLNARMVDFHGWELPLHYGSQIEEHHAVRKQCGIFDVSHMTVVDILGAGGRQFLRHLLTNDVDKLEHTGRALYTCMCNEHGGILDDLIVYQRSPDNYRLVLNSATRNSDLAWIKQNIQGFSAGVQERNELSMVAVQGPKALSTLSGILSPAQADAISTLTQFECVDVDGWFFARTGYTGEDGLEIILPQEEILGFWEKCIEAGIAPCGLAARDTLRLEAGLLLYGQDMDATTTPLESALAWTIQWKPEDRDFIGMGALLSQKQAGIQRKLVGLTLSEKGIMRPGQTVILPSSKEGVITSGTFSPTLQTSIALARIPSEDCDEVEVDIRGKHLKAKVCKPRFVKNGQAIGS